MSVFDTPDSTVAALVIDQEMAEVEGMTQRTERWRLSFIFNTGRAVMREMATDRERALSEGLEIVARYPRLRMVLDETHKIAVDTDLCGDFRHMASLMFLKLQNAPKNTGRDNVYDGLGYLGCPTTDRAEAMTGRLNAVLSILRRQPDRLISPAVRSGNVIPLFTRRHP